jgi:hypothetical protein
MPLLLVACFDAPHDDDSDLLLSDVEEELGTDPELADSDGDGLRDGYEVHFHLTDPTKADSDGDGDDDGWEVEVGLDPLDAASHRHPNDWPHLSLADKAELRRTEAPIEAVVGQRFHDMTLTEAGGQRIDLYDLALQGLPILVLEGGSQVVGNIQAWYYDLTRGPFPLLDMPDDVAASPHEGRLIVVFAWAEGSLGTPVTLEEVAGRLDDGPLPPNLLLLADPAFAAWVHLGRRDLGVEDPFDRGDSFRFAILDDHMIVQGLNDWTVVQQMITP